MEQAASSEMVSREARAASTEGVKTSSDDGGSHGHADDEGSGEEEGRSEDAVGDSSQGKRSRPQRKTKPIERLGVVPNTRPKAIRKVRKRKPKELVYMERAGAAGGELKF